ncbi:MAG: hypothetical protein IKQ22_06285 [Clostridia bacterium]|nr:hypothetical protein [Clostridia bacterium]
MKEFEWEFGTGNFIEVRKDKCVYAFFSYDDKLKIHMAWTTGHLSECEWDIVLACVKEAKTILKRLKRI